MFNESRRVDWSEPMNVDSYIYDLKVFFREQWWFTWLVFPLVFLTVAVFILGTPVIGGDAAVRLSAAFFALTVVLAILALLTRALLRRYLLEDDSGYP
jgi:magnesium-transporting ATPase (P-type)